MNRVVRVHSRQNAFQPVIDRNCVAVRRGGEQREVNDQSVEQRTRFGLMNLASLRVNGEALPRPKDGGPVELRGSV
jgi:hypothetical protein